MEVDELLENRKSDNEDDDDVAEDAEEWSVQRSVPLSSLDWFVGGPTCQEAEKKMMKRLLS